MQNIFRDVYKRQGPHGTKPRAACGWLRGAQGGAVQMALAGIHAQRGSSLRYSFEAVSYTHLVGSDARRRGRDFLYYLWCGPLSPIFGRDRMASFEQLFVDGERCV